MLTCQELTEIVTEYVEGRMSFWRRMELHMHLGMCRHCRAYLRQMRMTTQTLRGLPKEIMPDDIKAELRSRLRNLSPSSAVPSRDASSDDDSGGSSPPPAIDAVPSKS